MNDEGDRTSAPPRALRRLVDELKASEPPALDWERMESRLLAQIDASSAAGAGDRPDAVDTSGVVDLLGAPPRTRERAVEPSPASTSSRAEVLVPWDDEPDEEPWKAVRRPPAEVATPSGVDRRRAAPAATSARGGRWVAGLAAVAAVVAAGWAFAPSQPVAPAVPVDLAAVAREPRLEGALDLASLRGGDVVEASEGPVRFGREGVLAWTLSAGGRLRVVSGIGHEEPRHVVALDAGALDVEVVPVEATSNLDRAGDPVPAERFVVEVGGARVAVHGTAFRVVRSSQGIVVDVSRGVVAVGPREGAPGSGHRLEAPQRAAFGLDGRAYRALPPRAPDSMVRADVASTDERYAGASVEMSAPGDVGAASLGPGDVGARGAGSADARLAPGEVTPSAAGRPLASSAADDPDLASSPRGTGAVEPGSSAPASRDRSATAAASARLVGADVTSCIRRAGAGSSDARVTVSSSLVVDVDGSGTARSVRFDPPIRPDLQACAQSVFQRRFAGAGHLVVPIEVVLEPR